jgi:hypothetical protein
MARLVRDSAIRDFSLTNERFSKQHYFHRVSHKETIGPVKANKRKRKPSTTQINLESLEYFKYNIIVIIIIF